MGCGSSSAATKGEVGVAYKAPDDSHHAHHAHAHAHSSAAAAAPIPASAPTIHPAHPPAAAAAATSAVDPQQAARSAESRAAGAAWQAAQETAALQRDLQASLGVGPPFDFAAELHCSAPSGSASSASASKAGVVSTVERWLKYGPAAKGVKEAAPQLFWAQGETGQGNASVASTLVSAFPQHIVGVHLVAHDSKGSRSAKRLVRLLALQLAQRVPAYARRLHASLKALNPSTGSLDSKGARELWMLLLADPLQAASEEVEAERAASGRKVALLVGGIEELAGSKPSAEGGADAAEDGLEVFVGAEGVAALPGWIGVILLAARAEEHSTAALSAAKYKPFDVLGESSVRSFLAAHLPGPSKPSEELLALLARKSRGDLALARRMLDWHDVLETADGGGVDTGASVVRDFKSAPLTVAEVQQWPEGCDAFYAAVLRKARPQIEASGVKADLVAVVQLVGFVLAASEPFSLQCLAEISASESAEAVYALLAPLRLLFPVTHRAREGPDASSQVAQAALAGSAVSPHATVTVADKSVGEWFRSAARTQDPQEAAYHVDLEAVHATLAEKCWERLRQEDAVHSGSVRTDSGELALPCLRMDEVAALAAAQFASTQASAVAAASARAAGDATAEVDRLHVPLTPARCSVCAVAPLVGERFRCAVAACTQRDADVCARCQKKGCPKDKTHGLKSMAEFDAAQEVSRVKQVALAEQAAAAARERSVTSATASASAAAQARQALLDLSDFFSYAVLHGADHALGARDLPAALSFLAHPQYVHLRAAVGDAPGLLDEYAQARALGAELQRQAAGAGGEVPRSEAAWKWASPLPAEEVLTAFQRFVSSSLPDFLPLPELVYQQALCLPSDQWPSRLTVVLLPWFRSWVGRSHALVRWTNKPAAQERLAALRGRGGPEEVWSLAVHPGGKRLAVGVGARVEVWQSENGARLMQCSADAHSDLVTSVSYSPDGRFLASGSWDRSSCILSSSDGSVLHRLSVHADWVNCVAWSSDGGILATGGNDKRVLLWNTASGAAIGKGFTATAGAVSVAFSHATEGAPARLFSAHGFRGIRCWDPSVAGASDPVWSFEESLRNVRAVACAGALVLAASDGWLRSFDSRTGQPRQTLGQGDFTAVAVSDDGRWIASGAKGGAVALWSAEHGGLLRTFPSHPSPVKSLAFSPSGTGLKLYSCSASNPAVEVWDLASAQRWEDVATAEIALASGSARGAASKPVANAGAEGVTAPILPPFVSGTLSTDGKTLALVESASPCALRLFDVSSGSLTGWRAQGESGSARALCFSSDGGRLAFVDLGTGAGKSSVRVHDAREGGALVKSFFDFFGQVRSVALSADGKLLALGTFWDVSARGAPGEAAQRSVRVFTVSTGTLLGAWDPAGPPDTRCVAFSPSGKQIAAGGADGQLVLFTVDGGKENLRVQVFTGKAVAHVVFSPDGRSTLVTGGGSAKLVENSSGTIKETYKDAAAPYAVVTAARFSKDGSLVVLGFADGSVRVWSVSGKLERTISGHQGPVSSVGWGSAQRALVSVSTDNVRSMFGRSSGEAGERVVFPGAKGLLRLEVDQEPEAQVPTAVAAASAKKAAGAAKTTKPSVVAAAKEAPKAKVAPPAKAAPKQAPLVAVAGAAPAPSPSASAAVAHSVLEEPLPPLVVATSAAAASSSDHDSASPVQGRSPPTPAGQAKSPSNSTLASGPAGGGKSPVSPTSATSGAGAPPKSSAKPTAKRASGGK